MSVYNFLSNPLSFSNRPYLSSYNCLSFSNRPYNCLSMSNRPYLSSYNSLLSPIALTIPSTTTNPLANRPYNFCYSHQSPLQSFLQSPFFVHLLHVSLPFCHLYLPPTFFFPSLPSVNLLLLIHL